MRSFNEFLKYGLVKKKKKDEARAKSLIESAEKRKRVMEKYLPLNSETSAQIIEECYDIIREFLEAKLSDDGYKSYNHEAVVSYLGELGFLKDEIIFVDNLREIRHGTKYYGRLVNEEYARKVKNFLDNIYPKLNSLFKQSKNIMIDVHCHLDKLIEEFPLEKALKNAKDNNVKIIVVNGTDHKQNLIVLDLAKKHKEVKAALGIYPLDALKLSEAKIDEEIEFIEKNKKIIAGMGEVGLDLKEPELLKTLDKQKINLTKFVNLAIKLNKPIIIHSRKAETQTIELLEQLKAKKVIMHCFSGKMSLVDRIVKNGWSLSIPANVHYSQQFQDVVKRVPLSNLLCETDTPYLHPLKEWPNEPANVIYSYKKIAEIKNQSLKEVEKQIEDNYNQLFEQ